MSISESMNELVNGVASRPWLCLAGKSHGKKDVHFYYYYIIDSSIKPDPVKGFYNSHDLSEGLPSTSLTQRAT